MPNLSTNFDKLTISNDFMFKHVMLRPRLCKHLLQEILQKPIAELSYIEMEKTVDPYYDSRSIRLDIIVADGNNTHYNLEMQVRNLLIKQTKDPIIAKRTRYYQSILDVNMLQKGQDFDALPPSFIIFICPYDAFKDKQRIYTFKKRCLQNLELELNDEATVMVLNTLGTKGTIPKDLQGFYDYINSNVVNNNFTKDIADTIVELKQDKKVRLAYMTYETHLRDAQYEAEAKGRAEGLAESEVKGQNDEKLATAKRMLHRGKNTVEEIAEDTQLPVTTIKQLQAEMLQPV